MEFLEFVMLFIAVVFMYVGHVSTAIFGMPNV